MNQREHFFFLGIGGIGMSALARYLKRSGYRVSGYDRDKTELTKKLEAEGIVIQYTFDQDDLDVPIDKVVYTPAIKPDQLEFQYFEQLRIPMIKRSEMLQELLEEKHVIAIAGTHGKTTTSGILAHILVDNQVRVTAFVGGMLSNYESNFIYGESDWVIIEADEYDRSFLRLHPRIGLIQSMDPDHLDIYGNESAMIEAYRQFSLQISKGGILIMEASLADSKLDQAWRSALEDRNIELVTFGIEEGNFRSKIFSGQEGRIEFELNQKAKASLMLPGKHNVLNATGAAVIASGLGVSLQSICRSIDGFRGIQRRFEYVYRGPRTIIIDDYAHHPKEIEAAIAAARNQHRERKLTVVFQPHLYSRTKNFLEEFAKALEEADEVILVELFPAREKPVEGIDSHSILDRIEGREKAYVAKDALPAYLAKESRPLILLLGAGDVYKKIEKIKQAQIACSN